MVSPDRGDNPCPCCGYKVHSDGAGSYLICPICFWEDDPQALRWPFGADNANKISLFDAQRNYAEFGAKTERSVPFVASAVGEEREEGFRPIDRDGDNFEPTYVQESSWPEDRSVLYWWRPTFWRN
ncbi:CPCC family cysteine-rich protein [Nocardiopsis mangrovi]|uniref:CPCC family cysteine-rich protein n=1 Tax=Nocardiopsis mangrovi TaxID=1179818 RepID=A0ABV9DTF2_9ACTN